MSGQAEARRREATRSIVRYFLGAFIVTLALGVIVAYAVYDKRAQRAESRAVRVEYCRELEKLKAQNREDVARAKREWPNTLRLLKLEETPELRETAEAGWARKLARNAPKSCPYGG